MRAEACPKSAGRGPAEACEWPCKVTHLGYAQCVRALVQQHLWLRGGRCPVRIPSLLLPPAQTPAQGRQPFHLWVLPKSQHLPWHGMHGLANLLQWQSCMPCSPQERRRTHPRPKALFTMALVCHQAVFGKGRRRGTSRSNPSFSLPSAHRRCESASAPVSGCPHCTQERVAAT